jgi:hypothetical protein
LPVTFLAADEAAGVPAALVAAAPVLDPAPAVDTGAALVVVLVPECTEEEEQALSPARVAAPSDPARKSRREAAIWLSLRRVNRRTPTGRGPGYPLMPLDSGTLARISQ